MIAFERVTIRYPGAESPAAADVSFVAPRGAVTAVVGPNGSGKSTLVRALLGRVALAAGRVTVDGADIAAMRRIDVARRLTVVVQREDPVFPLRVDEYVALGRYAHASRWRWGWEHNDAEGERRILSALELADAVGLRSRRTDELSGGEWQRVRLARALAQEGDAVVLDEPNTFLDVAHEMAQFELLARLAKEGRAVLLVSHQLNLVARFATRLVLLHRGQVVHAGSPAEVMRGEVLEPVYQWPLVVSRDPAVGAPMLVPLRGARTPSPPEGGAPSRIPRR